MDKVITTSMTADGILVGVAYGETHVAYNFPYSLVHPKTALTIASMLCQDPTVPKPDAVKSED